MSSEQVLCDGVWVATLGGVGDLRWSHVADGGSEQAFWRMNVPATFSHPAIRQGAMVQIRLGPRNLWSGELAEPERGGITLELNAVGIAGEGDRHLCFDGSGNTNSTPDTVLDEAIERGLRWNRAESISTTPFAITGDTDAVNKVSELLDAYATTVSMRWGVDPDLNVYLAADHTTPDWYMTPGAGKVGLADDDYASDLYIRFRSGPGSFATVHVTDTAAASKHRVEAPVDATNLGVITGAKALDVGEGLMTRGKARYAWTNALSPSRYQLTTPGGTPADPRLVLPQQVVRLHGVLDEQGQPNAHVDFVIGRTQYEAHTRVIEIAPVQLAARTLGDVLQAAIA